MDVADEPAMADLFARIRAAWGGVDTVCINAGIAGPTARVEDVTLTDWRACTSMRCFVEARDVAEMAVFLASDAARRVSGQVIAVDGHTENPDPKL